MAINVKFAEAMPERAEQVKVILNETRSGSIVLSLQRKLFFLFYFVFSASLRTLR